MKRILWVLVLFVFITSSASAAWTAAFSLDDPGATWTSEASIDENQSTYAYETIAADSWSGWIVFTLVDGAGLQYCDKIQIDGVFGGAQNINLVDIDVSDDEGSTWVAFNYEGAYDNHIWWECEFGSTLYVNQVRVRFYNDYDSGTKLMKFYAFQWNDTTASSSEPAVHYRNQM